MSEKYKKIDIKREKNVRRLILDGWLNIFFDRIFLQCRLVIYKLMKIVHHLSSVVCFYHDCPTMRLFFQHSISPLTFTFIDVSFFVLKYLADIYLSKFLERKIGQYMIGNCTRNRSIRDHETSLINKDIILTYKSWHKLRYHSST